MKRILKSKSFYEILNCKETSTSNEIRKQYKKGFQKKKRKLFKINFFKKKIVVVKIHPDKNAHQNSPQAFKVKILEKQPKKKKLKKKNK